MRDPFARVLLTAAALATCLPATASSQDAAAGARFPPPPSGTAGARAAVDTLHGTEVRDPFRWLEAMTDPEVRAWVYARDGLARSFAARNPRRTAFRDEIERIGTRKVVSAPMRRGGLMLYARFDPTGPDRAIELLAEDADGSERVVVDPAGYRADTGETPLRFFPADDGRLVAIAGTRAGEVWETVRVVRVAAGAGASGVVEGPSAHAPELERVHGTLTTLVWAPDASGFFYEDYESRDDGTVASPRIRFHTLGRPQAGDAVVYEPGRDDVFLSLAASPGSEHLFIAERVGSEPSNRVLVASRADPAREARPLDAPAGAYVFAGVLGDRAWFRTDHEAPNGKVVAFDVTRTGAPYVDVVAETADPINTWTGYAPVGAVVAGGRLLVTYVSEGRTVPRLFTLDGARLADVRLPYEGSVWSGWVGLEKDPTVYYSLSGLADPGTVYGLDVRTGESAVYRAPALPYDLGEIRTDFVRVPARDGAGIPAFIVRRSDTDLDGGAPLILYGYGFAGWNAAPYFYPLMASLVQRGAVWVVAAVRGDGGYGTDWHLAGRRRNKPDGIADYLDVTRWLIENGYTSADRMIANGSSAGGALVSAAVVARPELFRALILDYPLVDVLRYDRFGNAAGWVTEYGTASDPDDFEVMVGYAPLQHIDPERCYPAAFLAPGENDGRAPPFHAYKLAAALERGAECPAPTLLRVSWGAGHASGADLGRSLDNWADQAAFLDAVLPAGALR